MITFSILFLQTFHETIYLSKFHHGLCGRGLERGTLGAPCTHSSSKPREVPAPLAPRQVAGSPFPEAEAPACTHGPLIPCAQPLRSKHPVHDQHMGEKLPNASRWAGGQGGRPGAPAGPARKTLPFPTPSKLRVVSAAPSHVISQAPVVVLHPRLLPAMCLLDVPCVLNMNFPRWTPDRNSQRMGRLSAMAQPDSILTEQLAARTNTHGCYCVVEPSPSPSHQFQPTALCGFDPGCITRAVTGWRPWRGAYSERYHFGGF